MFGTKGKSTSQISQWLSYGIYKLQIAKMEVVQSKSSEKQAVLYTVETKPIKGLDGFKEEDDTQYNGQIAKLKTMYAEPGNEEWNEEFNKNIAIMAEKFEVRDKVDEISATSLEDYVAKVFAIFKGQYAWFLITAKEQEYNGKKSLQRNFSRWGFVKSLAEIDEKTIVRENPDDDTSRIIRIGKTNSDGLFFDKTNQYHFSALAVSTPVTPDTESDLSSVPKDGTNDLPW